MVGLKWLFLENKTHRIIRYDFMHFHIQQGQLWPWDVAIFTTGRNKVDVYLSKMFGWMYIWQQNGICSHKYIQHLHFYIHFLLLSKIHLSVDVKMPVLDVFMTANSILLSDIHPTKHFWQIYIHCISAGCKNGNVPFD